MLLSEYKKVINFIIADKIPAMLSQTSDGAYSPRGKDSTLVASCHKSKET